MCERVNTGLQELCCFMQQLFLNHYHNETLNDYGIEPNSTVVLAIHAIMNYETIATC